MDVSSAQKAVLQPSQSVADSTLEVHGYDFNGGVDYEKLFDSYATTGFQATHLSAAIEEINAMLNERGADIKLEENLDSCFPYPVGRKRKALTFFLGYTSNLVSSGLRDILRFLVQHDLVDCVVTSAGGVEEDLIKCMKPTYIGSFRMTGMTLREQGLNRAGNLLIPNENYCAFEEWLMPILDECLKEQQERAALWTPSKLIDRLGREINDETSICYWAHRNRIPIFCPALTDGSIGDMLYFHSVANAPGLRLDIVEDVRHINTMAVKSFKTGVIILGGGFVKHHINNANLMRNGSDYTVYVNTGQEFDGSDSGAEPDEAVSWGKVKGTTRAIKVTADATLVFPIIAAKCFAKRVAFSVKSVERASLTKGSPGLSTIEDLRVPVGHRQSTTVTFTSGDFDELAVQWQDGCAIPGAIGSLVKAHVAFVGELTKRDAIIVKKVKREIHVALDNECDESSRRLLADYDAGDSVYFAFSNRADEVAILLERLGLLGMAADYSFTFSTVIGGEGGIPHVPNPCSARYLLTNCLDIRRSPGRPLLRVLAEHCANASERRRLLELCSTQGTDEFTRFVRKAGLSLVDVLLAFPSCRPSIECLMDLLPRLMPRAYSIANYRDGWADRLRFVYSLLEMSAGDGVRFARYGACSGWMRSLRVGDVVQIALKEPSKFRLPPVLQPELDITLCPLVLIGPGTGVAPFISFLQKIRSALIKEGFNSLPVKRYLIYGSSDLDEEFLFKDELKELQEAGVLTDLIVCESRPKELTADRPKYIYDALKSRCYDVAELLVGEKHNPPPLIFSCGDVKNMSKELWACFTDICEECLGLFRPEIVAFLQRLRTSERLIEDVWS